ncbi:long-chain-fatty-acid--CoA ligase [Bradyrhizobium manausense]|uniref:3-(methylthio)propionyl-CoA ligase n=1 Tax=Bradyrhizobium TaxID=374 RepID=UPI001BA98A31|nr:MULTISPECIES: 3-(methylthio)propionyl-CoA ligase [Bradyrhizobium]MBR0830084.1 long-chain-fatty-acid--CoA ligase [Bradyrhizobium manausense]UVO30938.1 long-chain-fatty-acid--CoA ligase [Bradyrhizobium arachidis]
MLGLMMQTPLLLSSILTHAARSFPDVEIISRTLDRPDHVTNYAGLLRRSSQVANALTALGVKQGDRVATLAWNGYRHLELYYGISCIGAVCHTVNPRLFVEQIVYIINHAEDRIVFFDLSFVDLVKTLMPKCPSVEKWIYLGEAADAKTAGAGDFPSYEELLTGRSDLYAWPLLDENTACGLCYTSGTTGNPKGVLYAHRSAVLHSFAAALPDACRISLNDTVAFISPMFHAMSWGMPYCAPAMGSKLVMPGQKVDGESLHRLFEEHGVTFANGVPTVWLGYVQYLQSAGVRPTTLNRVLIGGTACPSSLMEALQDDYGVEVLHVWGMTETSPVATISKALPKHKTQSKSERRDRQLKQGRAVFGVEIGIRDGDNNELPHDGKAFGDLVIRGPWIARSYYKMPESERADGWFFTGDVATIDEEGYMQITDRSKDVIKSGGEWISSIELENLAMAHPEISEAAVIGVKHPKWDERPLVVAVRRKGSKLTPAELLAFYDGKIAKWWMPDDVLFVDELPHGATGKLLKTKLRELYGDHVLPTIEHAKTG